MSSSNFYCLNIISIATSSCVYIMVFPLSIQISYDSSQLHGRIAELESELREARGKMEREKLKLAEEKEAAISDIQRQLNSIATER